MQKLTDLINIGKRIEQSLNEVGIHTKFDLEKVGSYKAWVMIKAKHPQKDICRCALYLLEGAIHGNIWYDLPPEVKEKLDKQADNFYKIK